MFFKKERALKSFVAVCVLGVALSVGCTSGTESVPVQEPAATDVIRSGLNHLAQTGEIDSGIVALEESIQKLQESDPAKASELMTDLGKLKSASSPSAVKSQASAMLQKL
jgi:hypothetical protein